MDPFPIDQPFPSLVEREVGGRLVQSVVGRDLHASLGVGKRFVTWMTDRIRQFGFVAGVDYVEFKLPNVGIAGRRHRDLREFHLSVDAAKHVAMAERNDCGRAVRAYFVRCEEGLRAAFADRAGEARAALERDLGDARERAEAASSLAASHALLQRRLAVAEAHLLVRDMQDEYDAERRRQGFPEDAEPFLDAYDHGVTSARAAGFRPSPPPGGPGATGPAPDPRAGKAGSGRPGPGDGRRAERAPEGSEGARVAAEDARASPRGSLHPRSGDPLVVEAIRRAGLRFLAYTGRGSLAPDGTTAGDAVGRLIHAWGMDPSVEILKALGRSPHRIARTTLVIRPLAGLGRSWPEMVREPGALDALAAMDFQAIDDALRAEGTVFALARIAGFQGMIERGLRAALAAARGASPDGSPASPDASPGEGL